MLLGRGDELGRLRDLCAAARGWAGRALVVSGDPGIGKSALLEASAGAAYVDGLRVLRTRGARSEATLPFAALSVLLRPLAPRIAELPIVQAALLGGARLARADARQPNASTAPTFPPIPRTTSCHSAPTPRTGSTYEATIPSPPP